MGGPLSPTLANIFMCNFEDQFLATCPGDFKPIYYRRYVDDCFLVFKDKAHVELFATYINSKHPNIKFTYEIEENNCLPFLDCLLSKSDICLSTSVYRKPTFTGLGLNFFSFIPKMYKINSIRTLLQRAYNATSSFENFHSEIEYLRDYFLCNKYPLHVFENTVWDFLNSVYSPSKVSYNVPKLRKYIKLPYYGSALYKIRNELQKILSKAFFHIDFQIILTNKTTIGSFFKIKDRIPSDIQSRIVYSYQCSSCNARYVGSTMRSFKARRLEHMGRSIYTSNPIATPEFSNIRSHSENLDHPLLHSDFKIQKVLSNSNRLLIYESLLIDKQAPSLNSNMRAARLYTR